MRLLALCGSLRAVSSNGAALQAAALLAPPGVEVATYDGLAALPHFNPDLDTEPPPAAVAALRQAVGASDGLLIAPSVIGGDVALKASPPVLRTTPP